MTGDGEQVHLEGKKYECFVHFVPVTENKGSMNRSLSNKGVNDWENKVFLRENNGRVKST